MSKRHWIVIAVAVVVLLAGGGGFLVWRNASATPKTDPAPAQPVAVAVPGAPAELKIGVLVTLASRPGQGSEWKFAAEGAQVAAERLTMGGVKVTLVTVDDKGSEAGAQRAVEQLADQSVVGIIAASQGSHLSGAVKAAKKAKVPLLLPYEPDPKLLGDLAWATGPQDSAIGAALQQSLTAANLKRTLLIDVGGGTPDGVDPDGKITFEPDDDPKNLVKVVTDRTKEKKPIDSVLISGPAVQQAAVVQALQGADLTLPLYLTPDATSPAFTAALVEAGGSLSTSLASVGPDADDAAALGADETGKAVSAFLAATRMLAGDPERTTLLGDQPFAEVADHADTRSHDAVIAMAYAITAVTTRQSQDGSVDPETAIAGLKLDHASGLAGPALDFSGSGALAPDGVIGLRSSDQDLGLRPGASDPAPRLIWFAAP
ncbi:ABC transporter substrate-binding protein [Microlunatus speluncae]|uniref:ABC transporter substrate-binding protein n=1 Tax=Microlunatus speluncae TaxID=2594267 RepID=UPI001266870E|nr:ABC transporter substrate-binding protein [Microlunatus speluncae]